MANLAAESRATSFKGATGSEFSRSLKLSSNTLYLGTTGITATIGGTSRDNIVFKAGDNFGVNSSGVLYAKSAVLSSASVSGTISGSTISGSAITGSTINISKNNGYLQMGAGDH